MEMEQQENIQTKECKCCHRTLPITEFYKKSGTPDGLQYYCKECQNKFNKSRARRKKLLGGGNPDLARFTPRQLMEELRMRGYTGELKYVQTINLETL